MDAGLLSRVQRHIGVTRVARITGLDRTGVEVACAIRPLGHVLQVCNGKGLSFGAAAAGAVMEAAELFCAERPDASELTWGKEAELRERFPGAVWGRDGIGSAALRVAPAFAGAGVRIAWRWAEELLGRKRVLVPANAVHCPPADGPWLGPAALSWNSNGSAAHPE